ncbi:thioesterase II family protein [Kutzneria albida]|uniref:BarC protein n=1 Tax=Kutzneria albida DSM 43870 TaxID=1449976 RepID=W5W5A4_9PSEU|nr:alpha/beta fold hydrolase [Kutzneria albida]AHH95955.1 BarC protein [Kutzneria albida DSM 43870]
MTYVTLICLPFAGAGASVFSPWRRRRKEFEVRALQLPGRENLIDDQPCTKVSDAVGALMREVSAKVGGGDVILFGHSLGAILAFELARALEAEGRLAVRHLFASGSPDPWYVREERATGLSEDEFIHQVELFAGYEHPALRDPELRELILPTLRADVEMHEAYRAEPGAKINAPITAVLGEQDTLVPVRRAEGWQAATGGAFRTSCTAGGHMYLSEDPDAVLDLVAATVREAGPRQRWHG